MPHAEVRLIEGLPKVVGSFGSRAALTAATAAEALTTSDIVEIRLDILGERRHPSAAPAWAHLLDVPLLFTARRQDEGGAATLSAVQRGDLLETALADAALIDIEVASIAEMAGSIEKLTGRGIPWIASSHDFTSLPSYATMEKAAALALAAGASAFKLAAMLHEPADLALLAEFQLADHGLPVATMGMGPLAPVSRLLCAQCGSVLNYGYVGNVPTAPGQWDSASLKAAISKLTPFRR